MNFLGRAKFLRIPSQGVFARCFSFLFLYMELVIQSYTDILSRLTVRTTVVLTRKLRKARIGRMCCWVAWRVTWRQRPDPAAPAWSDDAPDQGRGWTRENSCTHASQWCSRRRPCTPDPETASLLSGKKMKGVGDYSDSSFSSKRRKMKTELSCFFFFMYMWVLVSYLGDVCSSQACSLLRTFPSPYRNFPSRGNQIKREIYRERSLL